MRYCAEVTAWPVCDCPGRHAIGPVMFELSMVCHDDVARSLWLGLLGDTFRTVFPVEKFEVDIRMSDESSKK